jgi:hypothetical protein
MSVMAGMESLTTTYRDAPDSELSDARISSQLSFLGEQISKINAVFTELQMAIDPILLPELPSSSNIAEVKMPASKPTSEISSRLDELASEVGRFQQRILHVTKRVQL